MSKLFRKISNLPAWAKAEQSALWRNEDCPWDLIGMVHDPEGLSVWRVEHETDIIRTLAAIAMGQASISREVTCVVFDQAELDAIGVRPRPTVEKTIDERVNSMHQEIFGISGRQLIGVAKILALKGERRVFTKQQILDEANARFRSSSFDGALFVKAQHKSENKLLEDFMKAGLLQLRWS